MASNYASEADNETLEKQFRSCIEKAENIYFFNRLNVPTQIQGQGLGTILLKKVIDFCQENNYLLVNTVNAYGKLSKKDLISFYKKHGMLTVNKDGLLIYHPAINTLKNKPKI